MAGKKKGSRLDRALEHPLRKRLVVALWHSSEPLSARRIAEEYLDDDQCDLPAIVYHLIVLEDAGVVVEDSGRDSDPASAGRSVVLGGENAGDAVRRLGLADGRDP